MMGEGWIEKEKRPVSISISIPVICTMSRDWTAQKRHLYAESEETIAMKEMGQRLASRRSSPRGK
jgi:hypothetical protein